MKLIKAFLFFLFFINPIEGLEITSDDDLPKIILPNEIFDLSFTLKNQSHSIQEVLVKIELPENLLTLPCSPYIHLDSKEQKEISFYFKANPKIIAGVFPVIFKINDNGLILIKKMLIEIKPKTRVNISKVVYDDITANLPIKNDSNHAIYVANEEIPAFSEKNVFYKFTNKTANNFYTDKLGVYYNNKKVQEITVFSKITTQNFLPKSDEEFLFPINYGFAFANNKQHKSLTIYSHGGGQFARNQELKFSFSAPFYGGGQDPYLYFNPDTALFYLFYRYLHTGFEVGDAYYQNNSNLYYRYGRGYFIHYKKENNYQTKLGYVTKNQFYKNDEKDLVFGIEKLENPKIYYNSFYDSNHYNQTLGIGWNSSDSLNGFKTNLQAFNSDFRMNDSHSGIMGSLSYASDLFSSSFFADYIGNQFYGRTNSESRLLGTIKNRFPKIGLITSLKASFSELFPKEDPEVITRNFGASLSKKIGLSGNSLSFDYLGYEDEELTRNNYSAFYSFSRSFFHQYYLSLDQGVTYSCVFEPNKNESFKTYSKIYGSFQKDRWSVNAGFLSQVRYFSESFDQENSLFLGMNYTYKFSKAYINFNFSNATFKYKPSITMNYSTKFKFIDVDLNYNLTPNFNGYDWRAMVKFNFLNYLHIKKPVERTTSFIDKNTKKPIGSLLITNHTKQKIEIENGELLGSFSDEELQKLSFGNFEVERKFTKKKNKDEIIKDFTFLIDYRAKISGKLDFRPRYGIRESLNRLIFEQRAYALSEEGKYYYGRIEPDGSFNIIGLPVGRYKIGVVMYKLPTFVIINEKHLIVDYTTQVIDTELIVSY